MADSFPNGQTIDRAQARVNRALGASFDESVELIVDRQLGDGCPVWGQHLRWMGIAVRIAGDHGVHYSGEHRHSRRIR
jgi:hypothetical protein